MIDKIIRILTEILKTKITVDTERASTHNWDSTNHLDIIMTLEEEFSINIPMECFPNLSSVKKIAEYLEAEKCI